MVKTLNTYAMKKLIAKIGEYRVRNQPFVFEIDGITYTWSELGSDARLFEWLVGRWSLYGDEKEPVEAYIFDTLDNGKIAFADFIKDYKDGELPDGCDERTWGYLTNRCTKSIAFGSTITQVRSFLDKEYEFLSTHPRKE